MRLVSIQGRQAGRAGFTLVELLVSLALSIFIMAILSEAFVRGLEVFGNLKAIGDMEGRLRTAANLLRRDLAAPHFEGRKRLSECTVSGKAFPRLDGLRAAVYDRANVNDDEAVKTLLRQLAPYRFAPPKQGFFSVEEWPNRPGREVLFAEGRDPNGRPSYRDLYDVLHFTARLEGNNPDDFFYCKVQPGTFPDNAGKLSGATRYDAANNGLFSTQIAELLYFLSDDETANIPGVIFRYDQLGPGPVRTFNLHRQALGLLPDRFSNDDDPSNGSNVNVPQFFQLNDISAVFASGTMYFNTMGDVQHRARRRGTNPVTAIGTPPVLVARTAKLLTNGQRDGSDVLLHNVLSFDVKVWDPFAYKLPMLPGSGRGAFVDIGDVLQTNPPKTSEADPGPFGPNPYPTAAAAPNELLTPVFGGAVNTNALEFFDTGTARWEGSPGIPAPGVAAPWSPQASPSTHSFPFTSIQITIRVWEPKSQQTRQITIIQDM